MIKAIIFDFSGVIYLHGRPNRKLLDYAQDELKSHYKLSILSNSAGYILDYLPAEDKKLFDNLTFAIDHGIAKPDPEIYKIAAQRLGLQPDQCVFIDDYDSRVGGAKVAGMSAILYKDFDQMKQELEQILAAGAND